MIVYCEEKWYDGNHIRYEDSAYLRNFPDIGFESDNKILTQDGILYVASYMNWEINNVLYNSDNPWIKRYYVTPLNFRD